MHEVLVNRLGGLSLPMKSVVRLTDRPDMTLGVYRGRKTKIQQQLTFNIYFHLFLYSYSTNNDNDTPHLKSPKPITVLLLYAYYVDFNDFGVLRICSDIFPFSVPSFVHHCVSAYINEICE